MNLKTLIIILALAAVAVGVYYQFGPSAGTRTAGSGISIIDSAKQAIAGSQGEIAEESFVERLRDTAVVVALFTPENFKPVVDHFAKLREKIMATQAWKKSGANQMLEGAMQGMGSSDSPSPQTLLTLAQKKWSALREIGVVVSAQLNEQTNTPQIMVSARFDNADSSNSLKELIISDILKGQDSATQGDMVIKKHPSDNSAFLLENDSPLQAPVNAMQLKFSGSEVYLTSEGVSPALFLVDPANRAGDDKLLVDSAQWKQSRAGYTKGSAAFAFVDLKLVLAMLRAVGNMPKETFQQVASPLKALDAMTISMDFLNGMFLRQCVQIDNKSELGKLYDKLIADQASFPADKANRFVSMISPQETLLAVRFSGNSLRNILTALKNQFFGAGKKDDPEWQMFETTFAAVEGFFNDLSLLEIGVLVNGPRPEQVMGMMQGAGGGAPPQPDIGIYLSSSKALSLNAAAEALNKLATQVVGDSGMLELPIAKVADSATQPGTKVLAIELEGQALNMRSIDESSMAGSMSDGLLTKLIERGSKAEAFHGKKALEDRGVYSTLGRSDSIFFLSTAPLLEVVRPMAPMALMFVPPEAQLTLPEIEEALKLLEVQAVSVTNPIAKQDNLYCTDSRSVTF